MGFGRTQAIYDIRKWVTYGYDKVIDLDLKSYYDTIDHDLLMKLVQRRVRDARVLRLIRRWLRAGVMLEGIVTDTVVGAPQGAPISPLLSNIYLHPLDVYWEQEVRDTKMVRYADDMVVLCRWRPAETYMPKLRAMLARLRVTVNEDNTRIVSASEDSTSSACTSENSKHQAAGSFATAGPRAGRCNAFGINSER